MSFAVSHGKSPHELQSLHTGIFSCLFVPFRGYDVPIPKNYGHKKARKRTKSEGHLAPHFLCRLRFLMARVRMNYRASTQESFRVFLCLFVAMMFRSLRIMATKKHENAPKVKGIWPRLFYVVC